MGVALALAAALCYGTTHFVAGLLSRTANGVTVSLYAQLGGTALSVVPAVALPAGAMTLPSAGWGALSGVGAGAGVAFLYRGLGRGQMSVVAPVSEVFAAMLPVAVAVAVLHEHLSATAVAGIAGSLPAIWLISRRPGAVPEGGAGARPGNVPRAGRGPAPGTADGMLGGAGIALNYIGLAEISAGAGLWPFVITRIASVLTILPLVATTRAPLRLSPRTAFAAAGAGSVGTVAALLYLFATRQQLVALASVLASLYPAIVVLLSVVLLRERPTRAQAAGLGLAAVALVCCTLV